MSKQLTEAMLQNHVHLGSIVKHAHPKTSRYRSGTENNMIILDAEKVGEQIESAKKLIEDYRKENKTILLVCEKHVVLKDIEYIVENTGIHYFYVGTPSGILTNFPTLMNRIKSMNKLEQFIVSDEFHTLTKKEQLMKKRQLTKVQRVYKGVKDLKNKPDLVVLVDGKMLGKFVDEVEKVRAKSIVLANADFDRYFDDQHLIVMNTKSQQSLAFVMRYIFGLS
ncbi:MAG: 30S ribosomal protein S2 [Candidatus Absconditabacterales bacterium]